MSRAMIIHCPNCKYDGPAKFTTKGSFFVEVVLWLIFIIPGFIYSVWRLTSAGYVCPQCGYNYIVKKGYTKLPKTKPGIKNSFKHNKAVFPIEPAHKKTVYKKKRSHLDKLTKQIIYPSDSEENIAQIEKKC